MASYQKSTVCCPILLLLASAPAFAANKTDEQSIAAAYGQVPLHFEANQGQIDAQVKFLSRGKGYTLFLTPTEAVLSLRKPTKVDKEMIPSADEVENLGTQTSTVQMKLIGANPDPKITGLEELPGRTNYFVGSDPTKWRTDVPLYSKVQYKDVYPGIDLIYYGNQRQLEYDFIVTPGVNPNVIEFAFQSAARLEVNVQGDLGLRMPSAEIRVRKPFVYQQLDGARREVSGSYILKKDNQVGFRLGVYDPNRPLVIDPVLVFSTYLGGSGDEDGFSNTRLSIAVDAAGNAYLTGFTASIDFPTTIGAFQTARPQTYGTGTRSFFADETGVIRYTTEDRAPTIRDPRYR